MHRKGGIKCRGLEGQVRQQQAGREGGLEAQSWHSARVRPGEQPYSKEQGEDASAATACRRRSLRKQARLSRVKTPARHSDVPSAWHFFVFPGLFSARWAAGVPTDPEWEGNTNEPIKSVSASACFRFSSLLDKRFSCNRFGDFLLLKGPRWCLATSKAICLLVYGTGASGTLCDRRCPLGSGWSPGVVTGVFCGPFSGYRLGLADLPWPTQAHSAGAGMPRTVPECTVTVASAVGLTARPPGPP